MEAGILLGHIMHVLVYALIILIYSSLKQLKTDLTFEGSKVLHFISCEHVSWNTASIPQHFSSLQVGA